MAQGKEHAFFRKACSDTDGSTKNDQAIHLRKDLQLFVRLGKARRTSSWTERDDL